MAFRVMNPGLFTTVQDLGRFGHQADGFSPAGAMDYRSLMSANLLLGNDADAPGLEMTLHGASFEVMKDTAIATAGADMAMQVEEREVDVGTVVHLIKGETLSFGAARTGSRTYLAVPGGFDIKKVLGSASTHTRSGIGGYKGRTLKAGDVLKAEGGPATPDTHRIKACEDGDDSEIIRVIPGQQYGCFSDEMRKQFYESGYELTKDSDRMGFRLDGAVIEADGGHDVLSEPTQLGSIQIPKGGRPIILLNDRQTAGGYVRIATVARVDIPKLVQKRQGDSITFEEIAVDEATQLYKDQMEKIKDGTYLEENPGFASHRRPISVKLQKTMER